MEKHVLGKFRFIIVIAAATLASFPASGASRIKNWGLINDVSNSHINAPEAWKIEEGKKDIVVAVIDTGIDSKHPLLSSNLWLDKNSNYGWDFVDNRPNPSDDHGHGTHIAGIIGATLNPATGVSGVAHHVSIMAVKYYSEKNSGAANLKNSNDALKYAIEHGARIINYSGGGPDYSKEEYDLLKKAEEKGILIVSAAGNERRNTDLAQNAYYPSAYRLSNIISVTATDLNNQVLPSSNWGPKSVDIAAPGENILSTLPGGKLGLMTGTSQATAFVSGVAALLLSQNPGFTPQQIKKIIVESADRLPQLKEKVGSGGRLNALRAVRMAKGLKTSAIAKRL